MLAMGYNGKVVPLLQESWTASIRVKLLYYWPFEGPFVPGKACVEPDSGLEAPRLRCAGRQYMAHQEVSSRHLKCSNSVLPPV